MHSGTSLLINPGYDYIIVGLAENHSIKAVSSVHKHQASKTLISTIDTLLQNNNCSLHDLDFIAVNVGPGPFTTLRVAIATINGLVYGTNIPLIEVDGFDILLQQEQTSCTTPYLCILLNAFSNDVYFALYDMRTKEKSTTCINIIALCDYLKKIIREHTATQPCLTLSGNGTTVYQDALKIFDQNSIIIKTDAPNDTALLEIMAHNALNVWQQGATKKMLLPLYMKATSALIKK
jgi:tRNA threonylcarbamoyl adenosine modification protein YeaZ